MDRPLEAWRAWDVRGAHGPLFFHGVGESYCIQWKQQWVQKLSRAGAIEMFVSNHAKTLNNRPFVQTKSFRVELRAGQIFHAMGMS